MTTHRTLNPTGRLTAITAVVTLTLKRSKDPGLHAVSEPLEP